MDRQRQHDKQRPGSRGEYLFAVGFSLATVAAGLLLITGVSTVFPAPLGWVLLMIGGGMPAVGWYETVWPQLPVAAETRRKLIRYFNRSVIGFCLLLAAGAMALIVFNHEPLSSLGWLLLLVAVVTLHKCWLSLKKSATSQQQPRGTNMIHLDRVRSSRRSPDEEGK